ncbi:NTP transferase domain-containing protein [bacterium]|nr:NTP transferase domain-containing protein [bacterium]
MKKGIILAAGLGKRMGGKFPKVLFPIKGKPIISILLKNVHEFFDKIIVVVGFQADSVKKEVNSHFKDIMFAYQEKQLGTGHAVKSALTFVKSDDDIFILNGDVPLLEKNTLEKMYGFGKNNDCKMTVGILKLDDPFGYGRIIMKDSVIEKIVEEKDATEKEKLVKTVNGGLFYTSGAVLQEDLIKITNDNAQKEYYLTDIVSILHNDEQKVCGYIVEKSEELLGINTKDQLKKVEKYV